MIRVDTEFRIVMLDRKSWSAHVYAYIVIPEREIQHVFRRVTFVRPPETVGILVHHSQIKWFSSF